MHSSQYLAYARMADEAGEEIIAIFERQEPFTEHAATALLRRDFEPRWIIRDMWMDNSLTAKMSDGMSVTTYPKFADALRAFTTHEQMTMQDKSRKWDA